LKGKGVPANESIAFLVLMIYLGRLRAKKPAREAGRKLATKAVTKGRYT
jgi:hypothetical protein